MRTTVKATLSSVPNTRCGPRTRELAACKRYHIENWYPTDNSSFSSRHNTFRVLLGTLQRTATPPFYFTRRSLPPRMDTEAGPQFLSSSPFCRLRDDVQLIPCEEPIFLCQYTVRIGLEKPAAGRPTLEPLHLTGPCVQTQVTADWWPAHQSASFRTSTRT